MFHDCEGGSGVCRRKDGAGRGRIKTVFNLRSWFQREHFFIVEILSERASGTLLCVDGDRNVTFRKTWESPDCSRLGKHFKANRFRGAIIIAADPTLAFTAFLPVRAERDRPRDPLGPVEFENLLAQAVGKAFNQCREEAARELRAEDLDIVLANSRVTHFKIDDHRVVNPLGFQGRTVGAVLELTLTTRDVLNDAKKLFRTRRDFFFTEIGRAELMTLERLEPLPFSLLVLGTTGPSFFFVMAEAATGHLIYRGEFQWSVQSLCDAIMSSLDVSAPVAEKLYRSYLRRETSQSVERFFNRLLKPAERAFFDEARNSRIRGRAYLDSAVALPFPLPYRKRNVMFDELPLRSILERLGFHINLAEWPISERGIVRRLAPFFERYYDTSDSTINQWLRRHLTWLGPV